jgi:hypothetical protein|tara:strand:+ start:2531 stop:2710 length:180 start_codon:yes stop_codon:yes gene_type:complete
MDEVLEMKSFMVKVTYEGEILADSVEELEEKLWVVHELFAKPFNDTMFDAVDYEILQED